MCVCVTHLSNLIPEFFHTKITMKACWIVKFQFAPASLNVWLLTGWIWLVFHGLLTTLISFFCSETLLCHYMFFFVDDILVL